MKDVLDRLRAEMPAADFVELAVAITVLADQDRRRRGLRSAIMAVLDEEIVMQSWVWQQGREQGIEQGISQGEQRSIVRLFEKRLGRPLTEDERGTVVRRLGSLGYDQLVDVRDALSPAALATWLERPDAG